MTYGFCRPPSRRTISKGHCRLIRATRGYPISSYNYCQAAIDFHGFIRYKQSQKLTVINSVWFSFLQLLKLVLYLLDCIFHYYNNIRFEPLKRIFGHFRI